MKNSLAALTVTALLLIVALTAPAQDATGRIIGIVTDPTGAVVLSAAVTVTNAMASPAPQVAKRRALISSFCCPSDL